MYRTVRHGRLLASLSLAEYLRQHGVRTAGSREYWMRVPMRMAWLSGWVVVVVVAVLAGAATVLATLWLPAAMAAGAAAVAAILAGVWTAHGSNTLTQRDDHKRVLQPLTGLDKRGHLPRVRDLNDPVALGVHPAASIVSGGQKTRTPAFISRDITPDLCEAIRRDHFVLVVGESTAGKSRAVYEAMRVLLADHRLIEPVGREAIQAAVDTAMTTTRCVLWLDDLERFLGSDGLNGAVVSRILNLPDTNRFILATIRAEESAKYSSRHGPDEAGREALRRGWEVLRLATRVNLPRSWSADELVRAAEHRDDPRINEALDHADRFGLAEYLAAGPQLLASWQDAWAPGTHSRAAALILAAVDARRAGIHRPLPLSVLAPLHEIYLRQRGGELLRPEPLDAALAWATTPLHATSSLLLPAGENAYLAFDYLIDAVDRNPMSTEAIATLVSFATSDEAMELGELAWGWHRLTAAETAFRHAATHGDPKGTVRRCHLIRERDGAAAGLEFLQQALAHKTQALGHDHPHMLHLGDSLAWEYGHAGDPDEALRLLEKLLPDAIRTLGGDHERTLAIRSGIANWTGEIGDNARAAKLYADVVADSARVLGADHKLTIYGRIWEAVQTGQSGRPDRAVRLLQTHVDDRISRGKQSDDSTRYVRCQLALWTMKAGQYEDALHRWEQLVTETLADKDRFNLESLWVREEHAVCVGTIGDAAEAVRLLQRAMDDASRLDPPPSANVLGIARSLAHWTGEAGDPAGAVDQLQRLVATCTEVRGAADGWTLGFRRRLAHWIGEAGDPDRAIQELEQLINDIETAPVPIPNLVHRAACREELEHWRKYNSDDQS